MRRLAVSPFVMLMPRAIPPSGVFPRVLRSKTIGGFILISAAKVGGPIGFPCEKTRAVTAVIKTLLIVFLTFSSSFAHAYQCPYEPAPDEALRDADAVFTGTVKTLEKQQSISRREGGLGTTLTKVTFTVDKVWKGLAKEDVEVPVLSEAFYGYDFEVDTEYLVYAYRIFTPDTTLSVVGCPRVRPLVESANALHRFGLPAFSLAEWRQQPEEALPARMEAAEEQQGPVLQVKAPQTEIHIPAASPAEALFVSDVPPPSVAAKQAP